MWVKPDGVIAAARVLCCTEAALLSAVCVQLDPEPVMRRLLPLIIEHTIDERSPLIGHTYESLMAVSLPHGQQNMLWKRAF